MASSQSPTNLGSPFYSSYLPRTLNRPFETGGECVFGPEQISQGACIRELWVWVEGPGGASRLLVRGCLTSSGRKVKTTIRKLPGKNPHLMLELNAFKVAVCLSGLFIETGLTSHTLTPWEGEMQERFSEVAGDQLCVPSLLSPHSLLLSNLTFSSMPCCSHLHQW